VRDGRGFLADMEGPNPPLEFEVGDGNPAVLAKVFGPRIHEKSFHVEAGIAGVIEESPADRAVPPADRCPPPRA
jgi:hypothetical protein